MRCLICHKILILFPRKLFCSYICSVTKMFYPPSLYLSRQCSGRNDLVHILAMQDEGKMSIFISPFLRCSTNPTSTINREDSLSVRLAHIVTSVSQMMGRLILYLSQACMEPICRSRKDGWLGWQGCKAKQELSSDSTRGQRIHPFRIHYSLHYYLPLLLYAIWFYGEYPKLEFSEPNI